MARRPFTGPASHSGRHGGELALHRYGVDGDWAACTSGDIRLVAEMIYTGRKGVADFHCLDCDSWVTQLRVDGIPEGIGITHSPGCPWLTAKGI